MKSTGATTGDESTELNGYILKDRIGKGSFGQVYLAYPSPDKQQSHSKAGPGPLALKQVKFGDTSSRKYDKLMNASRREAEIMKKLANHPHIVTLYEEFADPLESSHCFCMEFADAGSLYDEVKRYPLESEIPESKVRRWFAQIFSAVNHMHMKGYVHRDLKLSNILLKWPEGGNESHRLVKLADFGSAARAVSRSKGSVKRFANFCGTLNYMAPEIIATKVTPQDKKSYNPFPADIWALGVCLFFCSTRRYPFALSNETMAENLLLTGGKKYYFPVDVSVTDTVQTLINGLLEPKIEQRFSMSQVYNSDWLKKPLAKLIVQCQSQVPKHSVAKSTLYAAQV